MNTRRHLPPRTSASSTSTSGSLWARRLSISVCSGVINSLLTQKKRAGAHSHTTTGVCTQARKLSVEHSIGAAPDSPRRPSSGAAGTVLVKAIVLALGAQRACKRQGIAGLSMAAEQLQRTAEAEEGVVVGGSSRGDRPELLGGACVALRMEQRPSQRLTNRRLIRFEISRFAQGHDRRLVVTVLEQLSSALIEVVDTLHRG